MQPPLFIIGTGRSGTTLMLRLLHRHPQVGWICQYLAGDDMRLGERCAALLARVFPMAPPLREDLLRRRLALDPTAFWTRFVPDFDRPLRDLTAADLGADAARRLRATVDAHLRDMGCGCLLAKYTGWSRIGFMDALFPGSRFLNVVRDGRAVAASLLQMEWWDGREGPGRWRWGPLRPDLRALWDASGHRLAVLAGIQWALLMENLRETGAGIRERYRELRYEDLVADPVGQVNRVLDWAGLAPDADFEEQVRHHALRDDAGKWRRGLQGVEREQFETLLAPYLERFGYPDAAPAARRPGGETP